MFKFTGAVLIMIAAIYIFSFKLISDYKAYKFLNDTVKLIQVLKIESATGKTYPQILSCIDIGLYKGFNLTDTDNFINKQNIDIKIKNEIKHFFNMLGKRDITSEKEYIENYIEYFTFKSELLKENIDKNGKTSILSGISAGLIIVITII